jgi:hypothetical protein
MRPCKLLLAVTAATVVFGALTSTAIANRFSSSSQTLRAQFREVRFEGAFGETSCQLTLEGSLHSRTITKVRGTLIGYITAARLGPCAVGRYTILTETLPWHIQYDSFSGTLPSLITSIRTRVINFAFRFITNFGENCLLRSTTEAPLIITYNISGGVISTAQTEGTGIPTTCFFTASFRSDRGTVTVLNSTTRITITLI